jgi:dolichyl-phosphate beta-glucosyltransferase
MINLSVIIPTYNEENRIGGSLDLLMPYLRTLPIRSEVLISDDGSEDGTVGFIESYQQCLSDAYPELRYILSPHKGKGHALRRGMMKARGRLRYMADADLSCPPFVITAFITYMRHTRSDIVIGDRHNHELTMTASRRTIGEIYLRLVHGLTRLDYPDTQCGFKLFTAQAAEAVFSRCTMDGFSIDIEALLIARQLGYKVVSMPVPWTQSRDSRVRVVRDSCKMFIDLLRLKAPPTYTASTSDK